MNTYIAQNQDLKTSTDELRAKLRLCEAEKKRPGITPAPQKPLEDPYPP